MNKPPYKYYTGAEMIKNEQKRLENDIAKVYVILTIIFSTLLILAVLVGVCGADEITEEQAVHCILGEARAEGYDAMLAHAEAIRNRGHLKGVYGCRANFEKEMSYIKAKGIDKQAKKAWAESKTSNTVDGAQYWGSLLVDGDWIKKMQKYGYKKTAVVKNTAFYRR